MSHLRISLFGGFEALLDGQPITAFDTDKARALLAYLAVESAHPHRRSELAAMLWPESPAKKAVHNLSQTLLRLRRALREDDTPAHPAQQPFLLFTGQDIQLNSLSDHRLDVADFVELLRDHRQHRHADADACTICIGWLRQAVDLYRGDLLAGFALRDSVPFEEWQLMQQEALHSQAVEALAFLAAYYERRGEPERVREYARRLAALEPWHEPAQMQLMAALARCGQGGAALEQYEAYSRMLAKEFGMAPSAEAVALYRQIQARLSDGQGAATGRGGTPPDRPAKRGERRQVTALICGRRNPAGHADPEDLHERLARCAECCVSVLEQYGGHRQPRQGAECLIYFGYPIAYEDAARRAVHAGLALAALARDDDPVHVGIHTGMMVCGEDEPVGDAPGLARGCQSLAEPNRVLVTADTELLVRGWFDCQPAGSLSLPGSTEAISLYYVTGESAAGGRLHWLERTHRLTRLIGREQELQQLAASLEAVQGDRGQVVTLCGEPGIGKSRLVWELMQRAGGSVRWVESRCLPFFQNTGLYPLTRLLEQALEFRPADRPEDRRSKLDRLLARLDLAQPSIAWPLALLLGLPTDTPAPQTITEEQRERMRGACLALLSRYAMEQPVVLVIEDLHWADPSTVAWLDASLDALAAARCLILLTYRPTFTPHWRPHRRLLHLDLGPLNPEQIALMVADLVGDRALPDEVRRRVVAQTDGIPLFVEELTRSLCEAGAQRFGADIPVTLRDSLLARLDRVGAARETAGWAAALGSDFAYPILAAVVPYDERRLQADLAMLTEADLIHPLHAGPETLYAFKHTLVQAAVYASLLRRTRRDYHRRIAETYTSRFPQVVETQPELVAQHYHQAGRPDQAADYWLRAGERATAQGATQEARTFFDRALAVIAPEDRNRRWRTLKSREALLFLTGDRTAEQADIAALLALAEESKSQERRAEALLCRLKLLNAVGDYPAMPPLADEILAAACDAGSIGLQARTLCLKAAAFTRLDDPSALQTARDAVARGEAAADEWAVAYATGMIALHAAYAGDYAEAAHHWTQVLAMVKHGGDRTLESRALSNLGAAYQYLGLFDKARKYLEDGIALCDLIGDRQSHAYNVVNLGGVMLLSGDPQAAQRLFEQGLSEAAVVDDAGLRAGVLWELGWLVEIAGDYDSAIRYLEEARGIYTEMGTVARIMETAALLAKCALGQGRSEDARHDATRVWSYLQTQGTAAMDEAVATHLTIAEVFAALAELTGAGNDSPTVWAVVAAGYELVMARAEKISDPQWRRSFLENVPANRAIVAWWQQLQKNG